MPARIAASFAGALALVTTWLWMLATGETLISQASEPIRLSSGKYYAVDSSGPTIQFDLPPQSENSCELLLSSLGSAEETYSIKLHAESSVEGRPALPTEIVPLEWNRRRRQDERPPVLQPVERSDHVVAPGLQQHAVDTSRRYFSLHVTDSELENPQGYTRVRARCLAEGSEVRIYADEQIHDAELPIGLVDEIVRLLDNRIIPRSRELLGAHCDVDGDGKLAILITPWLGRLQGGRTSVNGFVRSTDFRKGGKPPFSNRADVIYLNAGVRADVDLAALLAHEYTHAACFSARLRASEQLGPLADEEDWLSEAIAHVAEQRHGAGWSNLDHRIAHFLAGPEHSPLVVRDYYRAGLWRDPGCRGATFLFLNWLVGEMGDELLRDVASDPRTGSEKITALTGHSLAELLRHWAIALHRGELPGIDLHGTVGPHDLAGLRRRDWKNLREPHTVELKGTAVACLRVRSDVARRIVISPSPGARLQVTVVNSQSNETQSSR